MQHRFTMTLRVHHGYFFSVLRIEDPLMTTRYPPGLVTCLSLVRHLTKVRKVCELRKFIFEKRLAFHKASKENISGIRFLFICCSVCAKTYTL